MIMPNGSIVSPYEEVSGSSLHAVIKNL